MSHFETIFTNLKYIERYISFFIYPLESLKIGIKFHKLQLWGNGL
jgi:hypothetical protein